MDELRIRRSGESEGGRGREGELFENREKGVDRS